MFQYKAKRLFMNFFLQQILILCFQYYSLSKKKKESWKHWFKAILKSGLFLQKLLISDGNITKICYYCKNLASSGRKRYFTSNFATRVETYILHFKLFVTSYETVYTLTDKKKLCYMTTILSGKNILWQGCDLFMTQVWLNFNSGLT
jgi:hypothetical protein